MNLNNVAEVESRASSLALPRHSHVSKNPHTRSHWAPWCGVLKCPPIQRPEDEEEPAALR